MMLLHPSRQGDWQQVYFLMGDDYFLQEYFIKKLESIIFHDKVIHREILIPEDMGQQEIIDRLLQTDLFSTNSLFVLRNPQLIRNKFRDELLHFCGHPTPNHYLVIILDDFNSKLSIAKKLRSLLNPIDCRSPFENTLRSWAKRFFDDQGIDAPPSVVQEVLDMSGDSVYHIFNQIEKICIGLGDDDILTPEYVRKFGGWNREFKMWEFLNAVGQKDLSKALIIGNDLISRNNFISLIPNLTSLFQELLYIKMENGTSNMFSGFIPLTNGVRKRLPSHAKKFSKKEIENTLAILGDIDRSIKHQVKTMNPYSQDFSSTPSMIMDSQIKYTDEELIARFQEGDEQAYTELVNRYRDRLMSFVYRFINDLEKAEDIVQDTLLKLYTHRHYYRNIAKFSTWIYTIAGNLAKTELRRKKRHKVTNLSQMGSEESEYILPSVEPETGETAQGHFAEKQIQKAIQELPLHFRTVVILRDIQELSYEEISKIVDVPLGTVKSRINRARIQLQHSLKEFK